MSHLSNASEKGLISKNLRNYLVCKRLILISHTNENRFSRL